MITSQAIHVIPGDLELAGLVNATTADAQAVVRILRVAGLVNANTATHRGSGQYTLTLRDILTTADALLAACAQAQEAAGLAAYEDAQRRRASIPVAPLVYERAAVDAAQSRVAALEAARRGVVRDGAAETDPGRTLIADLDARLAMARADLGVAEAELRLAAAAAARADDDEQPVTVAGRLQRLLGGRGAEP